VVKHESRGRSFCIYSSVFTMQGHGWALCVMNGEITWISKPMGTEVHVCMRIKRGWKCTDPQLGGKTALRVSVVCSDYNIGEIALYVNLFCIN